MKADSLFRFIYYSQTVLVFSPEDGGFLTRLFVIDYRASLSNTFGQTVYLPIMFLVFGVTAGIVYWQAETPLQIMTAYCGSSIPSLLFMGSVLHKRINKNLEVSEKKNFFLLQYPALFQNYGVFYLSITRKNQSNIQSENIRQDSS